MNVRFLIDSIVQQTTVLIAQLATSGDVRAPLAHIANQIFLELTKELDSQGVSRKASADMFGMALRAYQRKFQRLNESSTDCGRSLWEAIVEFIVEHELVTRSEVLKRFYRDDETHIYWTNWGTEDQLGNYQNDGSLMRKALASGDPEILAEGLSQPASLVIDDTYVYWLQIDRVLNDEDARGMIMRAEKTTDSHPSAVTTGLSSADYGYLGEMIEYKDPLYWYDRCDSSNYFIMKISKTYPRAGL